MSVSKFDKRNLRGIRKKGKSKYVVNLATFRSESFIVWLKTCEPGKIEPAVENIIPETRQIGWTATLLKG